MGGKSKQAQRTKNNVRPSSSGRSAELLSQSAGLVPPPILLTGSGKPLPALFSSLALSTDSQLSTEYALCLKKLHKKDPITKSKALCELVELMKGSEVEEVERVLPHWTSLYRHLANDTDHRVREATQMCHGAIVGKSGRRLAPFLRGLVPVWVCSQHDPFPPAASHAHTSLHKMFSETKLPEVISFCKTEIVNYLIENIIGNVEQQFRNRGADKEETAAGTERCVLGALQGVRYLADTLPKEQYQWLLSELTPLLDNRRYWDLARHHNPALRSAWVWSVTCLWVVGGPEWSRGGDAWRGLGDNMGGTAGTAVWNAITHLIYHVPDWHTAIKNKKQFCDKIIEALESGGGGEGTVVCECLLPLVANLPRELKTPQFYDRLFIALYTGLMSKQTLGSKRERQKWVRSIFECVRYVSVSGGNETEEREREIECVVGGAVRRGVSVGVGGGGCRGCVTSHLSLLIRYWGRGGRVHLYRNTWNHIADVTLTQLRNISTGDMAHVVHGQVDLLTDLKDTLYRTDTKRKTITFKDQLDHVVEETDNIQLEEPATERDSPEREIELNTESPVKETQDDKSIIEEYLHNLDQVAERVVARYLELAESGDTDIETEEVLLSGAVRIVMGAGGAGAVRGARGAVVRGVRGALVRPVHVRLLSILLDGLHGPDRAELLTHLQIPVLSPAASWVCVRVCEASWSEREVYLRAAHTTHLVLRLIDIHLQRPNDAHRDTLYTLLRRNQTGEPIVSSECASEVVTKVRAEMCKVLSRKEYVPNPELTSFAGLVSHILQHLQTDHQLLLGLVQLCANIQSGDEDSDCDDIRRHCLETVSSLSKEQRGEVGEDVLQLLHAARDNYTPACEVNVSHIAYLVRILHEVLSGSEECDRLRLLRLALTYPPPPHGTQPLDYYAIRSDYVLGGLVSPGSEVPQDGDEVSEEEVAGWGRRGVWGARVETGAGADHVPHLARDLAALRAIYRNYTQWYGWGVVRDVYQVLEGEVRQAVRARGRGALSLALTHAHTHGDYYAYGLRYMEEVLGDEGEVEHQPVPDLQDSFTAHGYYHTLQARGDPTSVYSSAVRCAALRLRAVDTDTSRAALLHLVQRAPLAQQETQLELLADIYYMCSDLFLYNQDVSAAPWSAIWSSVSALRLVRTVVSSRGWDLSPASWDLALLATHSLAVSLSLSLRAWGELKTSMLCVSVLEAYRGIREFIEGVPKECERRLPSEHVAALPREWTHVFKEDLTRLLHTVTLTALERSVSEWSQPRCASTWSLLPAVLPPPTSPLTAPLHLLAPLSARPAPHVSALLLSYSCLAAYRDDLVLQDANSVAAWGAVDRGDGEETQDRPPPPLTLHLLLETLQEHLTHVHAHTHHLTSFSGVREWTPVEPQYGEVMQMTLGALVVLEQMWRARGDLTHHYSRSFRASPLCDHLMDLMGRVCGRVTDEDTLTTRLEDGGLSLPVWGALGVRAAGRAAWAAGAHGAMGGGQWWRQVGSPLLSRRLLRAVALEPMPDDMEVSATPPELVARLRLEERTVSLTLRLSPVHPQAPPSVSVSGAPPAGWVALVAWRGGAGPIAGALLAWRGALLGLVARTPNCYICYCTLHPVNGRPPSTACHHCNNKFHKECIRKWFSTSNKSSCPICRSVF